MFEVLVNNSPLVADRPVRTEDFQSNGSPNQRVCTSPA